MHLGTAGGAGGGEARDPSASPASPSCLRARLARGQEHRFVCSRVKAEAGHLLRAWQRHPCSLRSVSLLEASAESWSARLLL